MPLEGLLRLIEELRNRIGQHNNILRQSEMATRYILIDPLLRELGWDTENPEQVIPEYRSGSGSADYVLLQDGKPIIVIEAKKLDTSLSEGLGQAINYCLTDGTLYFAVTDGRRWEVYETHKPVPIAEKRLVEFDLVTESPAFSALKALALWRRSMESGFVIHGNEPLVTRIAEMPPARRSQPITTHEDQDVPKPTLDTASAWQSLANIQPIPFGDRPQFLRFPDGSEKPLGKWVSLTLEVVAWLSGKGVLTPERCPIQFAGRYLVNVAPQHPGGKSFTNSKPVGQFYVEANYSGPDQHRNTIAILEHLSQDPGRFSVRF